MKMRILIVDDEAPGRQRIASLLEKEPDCEVLGECASGPEALEFMKKQMPDLLFLDIQMPEMDGFALLRRLPADRWPVVIFVTAYDQHALKAFEVHALDYLLKPFKQERFREAVQHARAALENKQTGSSSKRLAELLAETKPHSPFLTRVAVKTEGRVIFVKTEQIDWIESAGNYAVLHAGKDAHVIRESLTALETDLSPNQFLKISRSAIINLDRVKELQPMFNGEHVVVLQNGKQLPMTRGLREVERALKFS